jgi:hypothetical protein
VDCETLKTCHFPEKNHQGTKGVSANAILKSFRSKSNEFYLGDAPALTGVICYIILSFIANYKRIVNSGKGQADHAERDKS